MRLKQFFCKKLLKIALVCAAIFFLVICCQALTRHFKEMRRLNSIGNVALDYPGLGSPYTHGSRLQIPDEYRKAFDNCHRFLELRQSPDDPYIVNDQKREYLVVTDLQGRSVQPFYESVTLCEPPEGEPAEKWESWMEILPELQSDGAYWSFSFPVSRVLYLYEQPNYEDTGDHAQVIINKENNKVVGYIFPEYLENK